MPDSNVRTLAEQFRDPALIRRLDKPDKAAMDDAIAKLTALGGEGVIALVGLLKDDSEADADVHVRHTLHALALHAGGQDGAKRAAFAQALASTLAGERPDSVKGFVIRQLQLAGGREVAPQLGAYLSHATLYEEAAQALLAIGDGAVPLFRKALSGAREGRLLTVVQGLGVLRDAESAPALRPLLSHEAETVRTVAAWSLARMGDEGAADALLKGAGAAQGFERIRLTDACLELADNLLLRGKAEAADKIRRHLRDTRNDPEERYLRDVAAAKGTAAAGF